MDALEIMFMQNKEELLTEFFAKYPGASKVEDDPENAYIYPNFRKWLADRLSTQDLDSELLHAKYEEYATD